MSKTIQRIIASVMTAGAIGFVLYAFNHPEASFIWSRLGNVTVFGERVNLISLAVFFVYIALTVVLFIAPFKKRK